MNWDFIASVLPVYAKAITLTVRIAALGVFFSLVAGAACCIVMYYKVKWLHPVVRGYIEVSRNTPLVVQLFFLYYGLPKLGVMLSGTSCAVAGLTFLGGSYMAESLRSGFEAVSRVQVELGLSIGLDTFQMVRFVIFPQAMSVAMPALAANCIFLIKETSVVSIVARPDLMSVTKELIGIYYNTAESLALMVACYLLLLLPVSFFFAFVERRARNAEFGV